MRTVALVFWAVLFVSQVAWWGWFATPWLPRALMILVAAGPLLIPLRGLIHARPRAFLVFELLALPYFAFGVAAVYAAGLAPVAGWIQLIAAAGGFTASALYLRNRAVRAPMAG